MTALPAPGQGSLPNSTFSLSASHKPLEQAVRELDLPVTLVREPDEADVVITLRNYFKQKPPALREAEEARPADVRAQVEQYDPGRNRR